MQLSLRTDKLWAVSGGQQDEVLEGLLERLLPVLASVVDLSGSADPEALGLDDLTRGEVREIAGIAGHLIHYTYGQDHPLSRLLQLATDSAREGALKRGEKSGWLPGDEAFVLGEDHWSHPFIVRFVGTDGTADVQPHLDEDYVVKTVPLDVLLRVRP